MKKISKIMVIALGGNALNSPENQGGFEEQEKNAQNTTKLLAKAINKDYKMVITHGNGPQVGNILLQQEYSKQYVPSLPLSVCGAQSQGQIGTCLVKALNNEFLKLNLKTQAVAIITHTLVNPKHPAFKNPQKPIGPIYTPKETKKLKKKGYVLKEIMPGSWRRAVPSPPPLRVLELDAIKSLLNKNLIPVAVGGGGIPVIKTRKGMQLIDAVIDKDLASQVLATSLEASLLLILTNIKGVTLNFQQKNQKWLNRITLAEAKKYLNQGHFLSGSMEPKIRAAIKFLEKGGKKAVIANLNDLSFALEGKKGTSIVKK